jgi:TRAP-type C4-dicarboxylate transport system permease small subunit
MSPSKIRKPLDRALEVALVLLMGGNVLNVLWQVFSRFGLRRPSSFTEELARYLLIWVGLLGASYASGRKLHLAIDIVLDKLRGRLRLGAELAGQALVFLFALTAMVVGGMRLVAITLALDQRSAVLHLNLGYIYAVLPLSGLIIMFYAVIGSAERLQSFRRHRQTRAVKPPPESGLEKI